MFFLFWLSGYIMCVASYVIWLKYFYNGDIEAKRITFERTIVEVLIFSSFSWIIIVAIIVVIVVTSLINLITIPFSKLLNYIIFNKDERNKD